MANAIKLVTLNTGYKIPMIGLGTWKSEPGEVAFAVKTAIDYGYRHIDAAFIYLNEKEVGEGIKQAMDEGTVKREDVFVTSKLWNTFHRYKDVKPAVKKSLELLGLDYLDLYLIHWPMSYQEDTDLVPKDDNGQFLYSDAGFMDAWKGLEDCVEEGLIRSIGVSNFNSQQIQRICDEQTITPALVQMEINAYMTQQPLIDFCHERGIAVTAHSPLGSPGNAWAKPDDPSLLEDPELKKIADRLGRSVALVLLRHTTQRNVIVIPKSIYPREIKENLQTFEFELSDADMKVISGMNRNHRVLHSEWASDHPDWPFKIPF